MNLTLRYVIRFRHVYSCLILFNPVILQAQFIAKWRLWSNTVNKRDSERATIRYSHNHLPSLPCLWFLNCLMQFTPTNINSLSCYNTHLVMFITRSFERNFTIWGFGPDQMGNTTFVRQWHLSDNDICSTSGTENFRLLDNRGICPITATFVGIRCYSLANFDTFWWGANNFETWIWLRTLINQ